MRKKIVAGNWKMNLSVPEGELLAEELTKIELDKTVSTVLIPPFTHLDRVGKKLEDSGILLGAQNSHQEPKGAFTGEVSVAMLKSLCVSFTLVGHSERRTYFKEDNELLKAKTEALLSEGITPIFCCGESLEERKSGNHFETVNQQLQLLWDLAAEDFEKVILAYEPVWAIGTGETATAEQAQEMHAFIRAQIQKHFGKASDTTSIIYGGSCKPSNAKELFAQPDVDGGLIGGASLQADDFAAITNSF
ncbi:MAG: triose-phosphate isomerase [Vicingaceae bacterium]